MKKNIVCNYEMDMALVMDGVTFKACDFEEEDIKLMIHRRRHTTAEKKSADAKWRVRFTGKKNGRSHEDYKVAKEMNEMKWSFRSYTRGGYDRNGIIQNRRNIEATKDAMNDIYGNDDAEREANYFVSLVETKQSLEQYIDRLELEVDEISFMEHQFREWMKESAELHDFQYLPTVTVKSSVFDVLKASKEWLAELEEDIDKMRRGVM